MWVQTLGSAHWVSIRGISPCAFYLPASQPRRLWRCLLLRQSQFITLVNRRRTSRSSVRSKPLRATRSSSFATPPLRFTISKAEIRLSAQERDSHSHRAFACKVGFIIGGRGGDGVLLRRNGKTWSYPAFYSMSSPSLGLQAGINIAEVVLLIMSNRALAATAQNEFGIGTEADIAILMAGGNAGVTTYNFDIVGWATPKGRVYRPDDQRFHLASAPGMERAVLRSHRADRGRVL